MTVREEIRLETGAEPLSHYTDAVRFGNLLFISGIPPLDADGHVVAEGDPAGQTEFILATMGQILSRAGASFADVLKVTVYLTDVEDRVKINPVRQRYFGNTKTGEHAGGGEQAGRAGMLVEIEAVAGLQA